MEILSKLADDSDVRNRSDAAYFWVREAKRFPEAAKKMIPVLEELTKDSDEGVRKHAENALKSLLD